MASAKALAGSVHETDLAQGCLFPPLSDMRKTSLDIAVAVFQVVVEQELSTLAPTGDLHDFIRTQMYQPCYETYT